MMLRIKKDIKSKISKRKKYKLVFNIPKIIFNIIGLTSILYIYKLELFVDHALFCNCKLFYFIYFYKYKIFFCFIWIIIKLILNSIFAFIF